MVIESRSAAAWGECGEKPEERLARGVRKVLEAMDMFDILIVMLASWVHTHVIALNYTTLNMYDLCRLDLDKAVVYNTYILYTYTHTHMHFCLRVFKISSGLGNRVPDSLVLTTQ